MPSKPLFGIPVVVGMSEAVIAMRSVPWPAAANATRDRNAARSGARGRDMARSLR